MPGMRSRGGCWSCRQKRRKCDETKPTCNTCQERGIVCGGYEMRLMEFRAQGNYNGQLICKLARGSDPDTSSTRPNKRRGRGARGGGGRQTGGDMKKTSPQTQASTSRETPLAVPERAGTGAARPRVSQEGISPQFAYTATRVDKEVLSNPPLPTSININPTPESIQDADSVLGELHGPQTWRRPSSTAGSQTNTVPSLVAATYPAISPCNDTGLRRGSASEQELSDPDLNVLNQPFVRGLDSQFDFGSQGDDLWDLGLPDLELLATPWTCISPRHDVRRTELPIIDQDPEHTEPVAQESMPWLRSDPCSDLDQLLRVEEQHPQNADTAADRLMASPSLNVEILPASMSDDQLILSPSLTAIQDLARHSDFGSPFDSYLYSHFFSVIAPGLNPVAPHRNPFKHVYGKLAANCQPLRATILGASALHLSGMNQLPPGVEALYRDACRVSLSNAVRARKQTEALAATVLLSIVVDAIGSGTSNWGSKLSLVRSLLQHKATHLQSPETTLLLSFLHLHFGWMTAIGRTVKWHDGSLLEIDSLEFMEDPLQEDQLSREHAKWFCNLPDYKAFGIMREATQIHRRILRLTSDNKSTRNLMPEVGSLLHHAMEWQPGPSTAPAPYSSFVTQVNNIWRQGLLCYIYSDICALPSSDERIQECVSQGMASLRSLSWLQSIIWPFFMIGVHALELNDRQFLESACNTMSLAVNFGTPLTIFSLFRQIWDDMDAEGTGESRWRHIMLKSGIEINLVM